MHCIETLAYNNEKENYELDGQTINKMTKSKRFRMKAKEVTIDVCLFVGGNFQKGLMSSG